MAPTDRAPPHDGKAAFVPRPAFESLMDYLRIAEPGRSYFYDVRGRAWLPSAIGTIGVRPQFQLIFNWGLTLILVARVAEASPLSGR